MESTTLRKALDANREQAEEILRDAEKTEQLLLRAEQKLKILPGAEERQADTDAMLSLVRAYVRGDYTAVPLRSVVIIAAALVYLQSRIDLIPDFVPGGYTDDAGVITVALTMVSEDIGKYRLWQADSLA